MERSPVSLLEHVSIRNILLDVHGPLKTPKNLKVLLTQWDYKQISRVILSNHELVCPCNLDSIYMGPRE